MAVGEIGLDYYWDKETIRTRYTGSSVKWMWPVRRSCQLSFTSRDAAKRYFRGDAGASCRRNRRSGSLLFVFCRDGKRLSEYGILF